MQQSLANGVLDNISGSTSSPKGIVRFWSCYKAVAMYFPIRRSPPALTEPDNTFWTASTFSKRSIKMKNNGENRTSMRSRNRSNINIKVALSCWFSFQNTAPCCDVKTVAKHQPSRSCGLSLGGLLPTWSETAFCDVHSEMCGQNSTIITYFKYLKLIVCK